MSEIQAILFDKTVWTDKQARAWLTQHNKAWISHRNTTNYHRYRLREPHGFKGYSMVMVKSDRHKPITLVIGYKNKKTFETKQTAHIKKHVSTL